MDPPVIYELQQLHRWQRPLAPAAACDVRTTAGWTCRTAELHKCANCEGINIRVRKLLQGSIDEGRRLLMLRIVFFFFSFLS